MTWCLLAFQRFGDELVSETELPGQVDDNFVKSLVGNYPNLKADSFPLDNARTERLAQICGLTLDLDNCEYFIEFRS